MATRVLDAYSKAYPSITNRIRASVFLETDPAALVATIIDTTAGHPARIWHFPGLPSANYGFSLDEINGGGVPINNLALFSVVPGPIDGQLVRDDEQIRVGTTPGFDTGATSAVFDGAEISPGINKPNYVGWNIVPSELTGRGILVRDVDYSWDETTGAFVLLIPGDILPANIYYNIHFDPIANPIGNSEPTVFDFKTRIVTVDGNIEITDFGNNIVVEPDGNYIELTLPDITTVPQGRPTTIETVTAIGSNVRCLKILPLGADIIKFLRGNIYMMPNETLEIYRIKRDDDSNEWRVRRAQGNFKSVGQLVGDDCIQTGVFCKQLVDGTIADKFQFARIYNEIVLTLPATQVCNFDDWATGNNKYLYSLANSLDPDNADKFHFPDRRDLFERNNNVGKAGDYIADALIDHFHTIGTESTDQDSLIYRKGPIHKTKGISPNVTTNFAASTGIMSPLGDTETRPKNYLINKYVLV